MGKIRRLAIRLKLDRLDRGDYIAIILATPFLIAILAFAITVSQLPPPPPCD